MPLNEAERRDSEIPSNDSKCRLFFNDIIESYNKAASSSSREIRRFYKIGCFQIGLNFANSKGVPLITPAFEHLKTEKRIKAELKIYLWDSTSTGLELPRVPWNVSECIKQNQPWQYRSKRFNVLFQPENSTFNIVDHKLCKACFWVQDFQNLPQYEMGSPLLAILHWWFSSRDLQLIHAAAVGRQGGGVIIVGKGGSGKSSIALSCLQHDVLYAGDDYCLVSNKQKPYVYSLYSTGKLNAQDIPLFPFLKFSMDNLADLAKHEKSLYFIHRCFPKKILKKFPLKAVLIPKLNDCGSPDIKKVSPAYGLLSLGPSTIFQLPGFEIQTFRKLNEVVKKVPCYSIQLSRDRKNNSSFLSQFLTHILI